MIATDAQVGALGLVWVSLDGDTIYVSLDTGTDIKDFTLLHSFWINISLNDIHILIAKG